MPSDLDRAFIVNGSALRIALAGNDGPPLVPNPADTAKHILSNYAKPLDASRWPMTRGELETRLSKALETERILAANELVYADQPGPLATELVNAIDHQGDSDGDREPCAGCGMVHAPHEDDGVVDAEITDDEPEEITQYPDVDAVVRILRELDALSGESGAGYDYAVNVLRFVAGRYGFELSEAE